MKKNSKILVSLLVAIIIAVIVIPSIPKASNLPLADIQQGINIGDYFAPFDVTGTPAPAIACSLTNSVNLVETDGSYFVLTSSSSIWSPLYNLILPPPNGKTLDHVLVKIYLYCSPSTLSKYGYYPYLTSGSLTLSYIGRDTGGVAHQLLATSPIISPIGSSGQQLPLPVNVNGLSIEIAQVSIPATTINNGLPSSSIDYLSLQNIETTGTLNFKQNLANSITATHQISPLYTSFSFYVHTPAQAVTCSTGTITINNVCYLLTQYLSLPTTSFDKSKTDAIPFTVQVRGWTDLQPYPYIVIYDLDTSQTVKTFTISHAPNSYSNNAGTWTGSISIHNDLGGKVGKYEIELAPQLAGSFLRATVRQDFVVFDSTMTQSTATNPNPTVTSLATTGNVQFLYKINFQSGNIENGIVPTQGIPVKINVQDLITNPTNGKMTSFSVQTIVSTNDPNFAQMNIVSSTLHHIGTVTVKGYGVIPLPESELAGVSAVVNSKQSTGQAAIFTLDNIAPDINSIDGRIQAAVPAQLVSSIPVIIEIDTSGTFTLEDYNGKQYLGTISGAVFTYSTSYGTSLVSPFSTALLPSNACSSSELAAHFTSKNGTCVPPSGSTQNTCTDSTGASVPCPSIAQPTSFCQQNPTDPSCLTTTQFVNGTAVNGTSAGLGGASAGTTAGGIFGLCSGSTSTTDCLQSTANALTSGASNLFNGITPSAATGGAGAPAGTSGGQAPNTIFGLSYLEMGTLVGIASLFVAIIALTRRK